MEGKSKIPVHVSIIMDGNGRWAKERGKERVNGHIEGKESVRVCAQCAAQMGVKYISLFAFSEENWNRPQAEVDALMCLMAEALKNEYETLKKNGIRLLVLGNRARLSRELNVFIDDIEEKTRNLDRMTMIIFLSYSGKWDILQAAKRMAEDMVANPGKEYRVSDFDSFLVTAGIPDPDLIIRTSGEQRLSNYLLWQAAYAEFYYTDTLWPDFREAEFREAIEEYSKRDRRYGKVK